KTAYEFSRDWSSDVCSSDLSSVTLGTYPELGLAAARKARDEQAALVARGLDPAHERRRAAIVSELTLAGAARSWDASRAGTVDRSEERRVGKGGRNL